MTMPLSSHDQAIGRTVLVNQACDAGQLHQVPPIATTFAPPLGPAERMLGAGPFQLLEFCAAGDGVYERNGGFFFGVGRLGLAMTAGAMAASAIQNSKARRAAADAAQVRWRQVDQGWLTVSDLGFHFQTAHALLVWRHRDVLEASLTAPGQVMIAGNSDRGPVRWIIASDWAELLFTMWARMRHPQHPQFQGRTWIPGGWSDRVVQAGLPLPRFRPQGPAIGR